jgi:hypothetical protein
LTVQFNPDKVRESPDEALSIQCAYAPKESVNAGELDILIEGI